MAKWYEAVRDEVVLILRTSLPIVGGLYARHLLSMAIDSALVSEKVFKGNTAPTGVPVTVRAGALGPAPFREGAGNLYVPYFGRLYYDAHYRTSDGFDLYQHNEELHPRQEVPCPMLFTDRACTNCRFHVERPTHSWQSKCSAAVWLEECKQQSIGLQHFRDAMM